MSAPVAYPRVVCSMKIAGRASEMHMDLVEYQDGALDLINYVDSAHRDELGDVVGVPVYRPSHRPGVLERTPDLEVGAVRGLFERKHETIHRELYPTAEERKAIIARGGVSPNRPNPHPFVPVVRPLNGVAQDFAIDPAGEQCAQICFAQYERESALLAGFAMKTGPVSEGQLEAAAIVANSRRMDPDTARRLTRLNEFIEDINEALVTLRRTHNTQGSAAGDRLLRVPDVDGSSDALVRDTQSLAHWGQMAALARVMAGQEKEPGRVLFELSEALRRTEATIEDVIAPKTRPSAWNEALQYSAAAGDEAVETDDDDEKSRLGQINDTSALAERALREAWSTGALAIPSIRATPIEGGTPDRYQRMVTDEHVFMGNLYAMATLRIGGSKGRYAAVAEMEVDELLRFIATTSPIEEEEQAGLRPEKLVLTSGKTVVEHGPDGIYNLTADEHAVLRGAIHIGKKSVLLVSEVKTTVSRDAISGSLNKVGGKQMTKDAEEFKESLTAEGVIGTPRQIATAGYLIWAMRATYGLLTKKIDAAREAEVSSETAAAQLKVWMKMRRVIEDELSRLEAMSGDERLAWVDSPDRKVSALLVVRACSLFGDTGGMQPPQHWGDSLPEKAFDLFDRTLVLDLFGLPVPTLCLERRPKGGEQIPSMERLVERVLAYNEHRFPFLLGRAVRAGFTWKDEKSKETLLKAIRRKSTR